MKNLGETWTRVASRPSCWSSDTHVYIYTRMYIYDDTHVISNFSWFSLFFLFLLLSFSSPPPSVSNPFHWRRSKINISFVTAKYFSWLMTIQTRGDARSSTLRSASESHSPSPRLRSECLRDLSNKRDGCVHDRCLSLEYIESSTFN